MSKTSRTRFIVKDSVSIVTGAGSGIGRELCLELARRGARAVVVTDINIEGCKETCKRIAIANPNCESIALKCNVRSEGEIRRTIQKAELKWGKVDCFMANAGILAAGGVEMTNEEWQRDWEVHVMQGVYVARHMIPRWQKQGGGAMLITASAAGLLSQPNTISYAVTKRAAISLADWIAINHARDGVHVSCLCPQGVKTPMASQQDLKTPAMLDGMLEASHVARETIDEMEAGNFLVTPHKEVRKYFSRRAGDYQRWINGMQRQWNKMNKLIEVYKKSKANPKTKKAKL